VETESGLPFAGLHRLLRPAMSARDGLTPLHRTALHAAFGIGDEPAGDPFLVALATLELLASIATRTPLAVAADDVQWLDAASRDVLSFVGRRAQRERIVVVLGLRDGYDAEIGELLLPELPLAGLDADAAAELLDARAAGLTAPVRRRLLTEAAGNPLALIELPAVATTEAAGTTADVAILPITVRLERAFAKRVRALPEDTRALL